MSTSNKIPGPRSQHLARRLRRVESRNVTYRSNDFPVFWESAHGATVRDVDGNRYLDLTSAFAVANLGHTPAILQRAIRRQSQKMWHGMGDIHPNAVKVELLERLASLAPGDLSVSILSSSGAEAVESALKTARLYTGKPGVIAFEGAYHGLSYGTLAVTNRADFKVPFKNQLSSFAKHLPYDSLERVKTCLRRDQSVGAILVEPIQGRGGVRIPSRSFMRGLRHLADRYRVVLIADEVFTGFGRTGRMFAVEHSNVVPDLLCVGKGLANGFPISACIGSRRLMNAWPQSDGEAIHTSTFLGNPLGCAMAVATLGELKRTNLVRQAAERGDVWKKQLIETLGHSSQVADIRGVGLMLGIEFVSPDAAARVVTNCLKRKLLVLSGGKDRNVLTLTPPLTIKLSELTQATRILRAVIDGTH